MQREATAGEAFHVADRRFTAGGNRDSGAVVIQLYVHAWLRGHNARSRLWTQIFLAITGLLGLVFVLLELQEFIELAERGITPQRSGMLTAFFGLVGLHGVHVTRGRHVACNHDGAGTGEGFRREIVRKRSNVCSACLDHADPASLRSVLL